MIKIENMEVIGWEHAIRGMRNPHNSWEKSDSIFCKRKECGHCELVDNCGSEQPDFFIGFNDRQLMQKLAKGGPVHAKYRRYIDVYVDITAPLYFWKEFDTYRVGVCPNPSDIEMNSCSTMHKIAEKEFETSDFSHEHLTNYYVDYLLDVIHALNDARQNYLETKDKKYWWAMIQHLPSSYNQKRTLKLNYEVLANMYEFRKDHKLDEWRELMEYFKKNCPYSEIFTVDSVKARIDTAVNESLIKAKDDIHNMLLEYIYESRNVDLLRLLDENIKMIIDTHLHKTEDKND